MTTELEIPELNNKIASMLEGTKKLEENSNKVKLTEEISLENKDKLIELLNKELRGKSHLISQLYEVLNLMKEKIISLEKIQKFSDEENILLTVKNKHLEDKADLLTPKIN